MPKFTRYMHVERIDSADIDGIFNGKVYVFPKIDGANGSIWVDDGKIFCASRNQTLTPEWNNGKFYQHATETPCYTEYLTRHPTHILYGEWMIPHTIKNYDARIWNHFILFDVFDTETGKFIPYDEYESELTELGIWFLNPLAVLTSPAEADVTAYATKNTYMMKDDAIGEGIVFKNYEYSNPWGNIIWGKVVNADFKTKSRAINKGEIVSLEKEFVESKVTLESISHEYYKFLEDGKLDMREFPKILGLCWHEFITDNIFQLIKHAKRNSVNFITLHKEFDMKAKEYLNVLINTPNTESEVESK